jgi:succinate dehydrogenase / fumarate reductase cytochrome b subunit
MSGYFSSSVGRKFFMALTGLFLVVFLLVHLIANLTLFGGPDAFNAASHFMGTNPLIQIMQPVLGLGFIAHIIMGIVLEIKNISSRPINYTKNNAAANSPWASRNMIITGVMILLFLGLHIVQYFVPFKTTEIHNHYDFVIELFKSPLYTLLYVLAFVLLGLHLIHGFQSSMTTTGIRHEKYRKCIVNLGIAFSILITVGFSAIALWFHFANIS